MEAIYALGHYSSLISYMFLYNRSLACQGKSFLRVFSHHYYFNSFISTECATCPTHLTPRKHVVKNKPTACRSPPKYVNIIVLLLLNPGITNTTLLSYVPIVYPEVPVPFPSSRSPHPNKGKNTNFSIEKSWVIREQFLFYTLLELSWVVVLSFVCVLFLKTYQ